ncbi:MAG TPA: periplasmic heavy metal sensor [Roseiarcus sp.]|jgi:Spy/CpxP family protein refolding chaperone
MSDIDNVPLRPEPPIRQGGNPNPGNGASGWPRTLAMAGVLACGVALGAGSLAFAAGMDHWSAMHGQRLAFIQRAVAHALDSVGASSEQEAKVHDIIASKFDDVAPKPGDHEALRKQALELLAAPTIDRAAVERLRLDAVAIFDAKSKAIVGGVLDVADQLTPQQRADLANQLADAARRGPLMGGWGERRHGSGDHDIDPGKD